MGEFVMARVTRRQAAMMPALALLFLGAPALAQETPDYSDVTSRERAEQLVAEGRLARILLFPAEFGGEDNPLNTAFVPPAIVAVRQQLIATLTGYVEQRLVDRMTVSPEYRGNSMVPARIRFRATSSTGPATFEPVIEIW
jgi:hypothetical protein